MRAVAISLLVGCHAATPIVAPQRAVPIQAPPEPSYAERTTPVPAKPLTKQRYGARDLFEPVIVGRDVIAQEAGWRSAAPAFVDVSEIDYLGRCVRDFVLKQPETARRSLVNAFAHYVTACDAETGQPTLDRPLGLDNRDRRGSSDAVFLGSVAPGGRGLSLQLTSCGADSTFEKITIVGSDEEWTSQRLEVRRRTDGCDIAELPYSRRLADLILRTTTGDASIRFEGTANTLAVDDSLREELRGVIDAVDAITLP